MTDAEILWEAAEYCELFSSYVPYSCDCIIAVARRTTMSEKKITDLQVRYRKLFAPGKTDDYWLTKGKPIGLGADDNEDDMRDLRVTMLCLAAAVFNDEDSDGEVESTVTDGGNSSGEEADSRGGFKAGTVELDQGNHVLADPPSDGCGDSFRDRLAAVGVFPVPANAASADSVRADGGKAVLRRRKVPADEGGD